MAGPLTYSMTEYATMLADRVRTDAYCTAIQRLVTPRSVVLDIGTGSGFFAMWAERCGARKVYAIEPSPAVDFAGTLAALNGCAGKITFIREISTRVTLPEPADVIISDLRGITPLFQHHLKANRDARARLLAPGGWMIPAMDTLWIAPLVDEELFRHRLSPTTRDFRGLDMSSSSRFVTDNPWPIRLDPAQILDSGQCWASLDYDAAPADDVPGRASWTVDRDTRVYGYAVWFDSTLIEGVSFSNAPGRSAAIYGQMVLPLRAPLACGPGESISAVVSARLVGQQYVWSWDTFLMTPDGVTERQFQQSTFWGHLWLRRELGTRRGSFVPTLSDEGRIACRALDHMSRHMTVVDIAANLRGSFPQAFSTIDAAMSFVGDLATRYGRDDAIPELE